MDIFGNWHPIIVHFPIALLTVYAALFFLRPLFERKGISVDTTLNVLLVLGVVGLFLAGAAGERLEGRVEAIGNQEVSAVLMRHSLYAGVTQFLAVLVLFFQLLPWLRRNTQIGLLRRISVATPVHAFATALLFAAILLTASEGGKLAHTYHVGEKANIHIAHPVGAISGTLIPDTAIERLEELER